MISTGMPRPSSTTVTELSGWSVTSTRSLRPAERLVDGVVDDLVDEVVEAAGARRADVHARAQPDRLETFEDGDVLCGVASLGHNHEKGLQIAALSGLTAKCIRHARSVSGPLRGSQRPLSRPLSRSSRRRFRRRAPRPRQLSADRAPAAARSPRVVLLTGSGSLPAAKRSLAGASFPDRRTQSLQHRRPRAARARTPRTRSSSRRAASRRARCAPATRCARSSRRPQPGQASTILHHARRRSEAAELGRDVRGDLPHAGARPSPERPRAAGRARAAARRPWSR